MTQPNNISNYKQYINTIREEAPKSENKGQVAKTVAFFQKDAFVETKLPSSYDGKHSQEHCTNFASKLFYWQLRDLFL